MKAKISQYEKILRYLRANGKATTWELSQAARSLCVHRRVAEMTNYYGEVMNGYVDADGCLIEVITREPIKIGSRNVTLYRLVRA